MQDAASMRHPWLAALAGAEQRLAPQRLQVHGVSNAVGGKLLHHAGICPAPPAASPRNAGVAAGKSGGLTQALTHPTEGVAPHAPRRSAALAPG